MYARSGEAICQPSHRRYYFHSLGHWLGGDTHDTATVAQDVPLQPGVVLTIEPGLYLPQDDSACGRLRGIGVRLEDDVRVTASGCEVLSRAAPIQLDDVEAAVRG